MPRLMTRLLAVVGAAALVAACTPTTPAPSGAGTVSTAATSATAATAPVTASALISKMRTAMNQAEWGHMKISGFSADGAKPLLMEYTGRVDGTNTRSSILTEGVETRIMVIGTDTYLSGNAAFWTKQGKPESYATRWKLLSPANAAKANEITFKDMLSRLFDPNWEVLLAQTVEAGTANGKPAWTINFKTGPQDGYITIDAATGLPVVAASKDNTGIITFTDWNVPQPLNALPAAGDLIGNV